MGLLLIINVLVKKAPACVEANLYCDTPLNITSVCVHVSLPNVVGTRYTVCSSEGMLNCNINCKLLFLVFV